METYKRLNRWLRVIQFTYLSAFASFLNYLTLYLDNVGFSELKIGIINAASAVLIMILQPTLGRILDRTQNFRQVVRIVLVISSVGIAITPFLESLMWLQLLFIILLSAVTKQFGSVFDLWTYQLKAQYPQVEYGSTRGMGSLGEGVATFAVGYLIAWFGFGAMFGVTVVLLLAALYAGLQLPNPPKAEKSEEDAQVKVKVTWTKPLLFYIASYLTLKISLTIISTFSSLMVQNLGFGSEWFGITILICGIVELPMFMLLGKWCQGEKTKLWYRLCMLLGIISSLLVALATNLPVFMVGRVLQTVVYAMYTVANLEYVKNNVNPAHQGQVVLMIGAFSSSASYIVSSLLGGYILEMGTPKMMAITMVVIFSLAFLLHFGGFTRRKPAKNQEQ